MQHAQSLLRSYDILWALAVFWQDCSSFRRGKVYNAIPTGRPLPTCDSCAHHEGLGNVVWEIAILGEI